MMQLPELRVEIKDYPYDPRLPTSPVVESKKVGDRQLYHVYIRLEGPDLPLVKTVNYFFDSSVSPQQLMVMKGYDNPDCLVDMWLWGVFPMSGTVMDVRGGETQLSHALTFGSYFEAENFKAHGLSLKTLNA